MTRQAQEVNRDLSWQGTPRHESVIEDSGGGGTHRDQYLSANVDDRVTTCLAAVTRCNPLTSMVEIGKDGDTEYQPSMPIALAENFPAHAAVWQSTQECHQEFGGIPDRECFLEIARRIVAETVAYSQHGSMVSELIYEIFSPRFDQMNVEVARSLVAELLEELLVLEPQARALRDWQESGDNGHREVCLRATDIQAVLDSHRSGQRQRLRGYSVAELRRVASQPRWHIDGILVQQETAFLAGPHKSLKSGIGVDLAVSLALPPLSDRAPLFLNRFPCNPAEHVLLFSAESGKCIVLQRIDQVLASKPQVLALGNRRQRERLEYPADALNLTCYFNPPRLSLKEDQRIVRQQIRAHNAVIVIFDPYYLMVISGTKTEASNVFQMGEAIRRIEEICKEEGATPLFVHHFRKDIRVGATPTLAHMAFAGAAEMAAQWILINHRKDFDVTNSHFRLKLLVGGRAGHSSAWAVDVIEGRLESDFSGREWQVEVLSQEEAADRDGQIAGQEQQQRTEGTINERAERIAEFLATLPSGEGICITPLSQRLGINHNNCREALERLVNQERVEMTDVRSSNGAHRGYRLTNTENVVDDAPTEMEDENGRQ